MLTLAARRQKVEALIGSAGLQARYFFLVGARTFSTYLNLTAENDFEGSGRLIQYNAISAPLIVNTWTIPTPTRNVYGRVALGAETGLWSNVSITRGVWAPIGERPIALGHHRFEWLYVTGFVEPATGATVWNISNGICKPLFELVLADFAASACPNLAQLIIWRSLMCQCPIDRQYDAAILAQDDGIGTDVSAIAAQILSCPQIKRAIVKRTDDGRPTDEAVGKWSPSMRAIGLSREHLAGAGVVDGDL